jgi:shikimate dehydrogenase
MHISGTTRVFMVIGDPVAQVQAPALFNPVFTRFGVNAVLVPAQVPAQHVTGFVTQVLQAGNIDGLWVTVPHKPALLPCLTRMDRAAQLAGAVNAVRRNAAGELEGGLFDGLGLVAALRQVGIEPRGRRVLLVGAGGAGAAIAVALLESGVAALGLHDLGERALRLAEQLRSTSQASDPACPPIEPRSGPQADPAGYDVVIHATPLGLREDDPLPFDVARLDPGTRVFDILMKPRPTPLLRACAARGIEAHPGFEMLVQQMPDYLDFFGLPDAARALRADLSDVRRTLSAG